MQVPEYKAQHHHHQPDSLRDTMPGVTICPVNDVLSAYLPERTRQQLTTVAHLR
jgi:hypothetical protein